MENKSKYRLIYLYQILIECSDENHPLSTMELIEILKNRYSIDVNRNTLGKDLEVMKQGGLPVEVIHSTQNKYYYDPMKKFLTKNQRLLPLCPSRFFHKRRMNR